MNLTQSINAVIDIPVNFALYGPDAVTKVSYGSVSSCATIYHIMAE
jgi:hypothetical protein